MYAVNCAQQRVNEHSVCFAFAGEEMSRNNHGKLMAQLFADLGVETAKLTHEMRIFASQLMYEMGVSLEVRQARVTSVTAADATLGSPCSMC
jgi:hypothetical protein